MKKILLIGNPNVGKSVIFSRLTGVRVIASNYPGTTVEFCRGCIGSGAEKIDVVDVPGTYSLDPTSPAERVAVAMLDRAVEAKDSIAVNVLDATNLERNLNLTLQLLKKDIPVIVALNLWDEAKHIGITIDVNTLEKTLGVPIVATVAITGEGIKELVNRLGDAAKGEYSYDNDERWHEVGRIVDRVQSIKHKHHTVGERLGDLTIHPWTGIPIAFVILFLLFFVIRFIGEGLIAYITEPFFGNIWAPLIMQVSRVIGPGNLLHKIIIGELIDGAIDFQQSFGILTTGLYVPIGAVLPYIFAFYLVLSILEDTGYLPRLAVLLDNTLHIIGLHGMAIVPMFLAAGCNVPGVLATRILETKRERFIAATLMSISIPCVAQTAMITGLLGKYGARGLFPVFATLIVVWLVAGNILRLLVKGESPEIFTEIPPYRLPHLMTLIKKVWMRIHWFLHEAVPFVLLGVFAVNILYALGVITWLGNITGPITTRLLGLPLKAVGALLIGFFRKDIAVGMLAPLGLTLKQLIIASVVLTMYFPCIATFVVLLKELGIVDMFKAAFVMISSALIVGGLLNVIL
ncbi:iron transporter FeoB [candidate division WOR_3 bacterium SM23_42]|uniref:Iron transporter FeoB n=1 Tax=candidate division WOR_3 bacterium SM23_42 TaxID=1703779 RepID=A0A0S8FXI4_UNCW3|nr:MAG: iron transporter FeoB [candidate division WOR_3 bacterium SM23_42]